MAKRIVDPRVVDVWPQYAQALPRVASNRLRRCWQQLFRTVILELMPAERLGEHFHPDMGRPTKELYSVAGLILIKEFMNWTDEMAADRYSFDVSIQYALNLPLLQEGMCERTLERYLQLFRHDEMAGQVMQQVTAKLVDVLDLNVSQQRLDSTHVFSNMAVFGRTRLMGVAIKNFLSELKRLQPTEYNSLPEELRKRYEPSRSQLFGSWKKDDDWTGHRQEVAENMHWLYQRYTGNTPTSSLATFQVMVKVFHQQCQLVDDGPEQTGKVEVRKAPGGNIIVNPSDGDATLDGHKGSGYQIQLSETCSPENEVQLIVSALPEQAHQSDAAALPKVLSDLQQHDLLPEEMLADTAYGSDANYCRCQQYGVDLVSPVPGKASEEKQTGQVFSETDFPIQEREVVDGYGKTHINPFITSCPTGQIPHRSHYDHVSDKLEILNFAETCQACSELARCPVRYACGWMIVTIHAKPLRTSRRRAEQETDCFRQRYRRRSGIEATNSLLKRVTGLGRLRVRGKRSVFQGLLLKIAGWNILRAACSKKLWALLRRLFWSLYLLANCRWHRQTRNCHC